MAIKAACHRVSRTVMHMRIQSPSRLTSKRRLPEKGNRQLGYPHRFQRDLRATADLVTRGRVEGPAGLRW